MRSKLLAHAVAVGFCAVLNGPAQAQTPPQACPAKANWLPHSRTPPPNSVAFPGPPAGTPVTNCAFHQWSWNAFLWLTQNVKGRPRFESFTQTGIGTSAKVLNAMIGRSAKAETLDIIGQAGPDGIMVDLQGHPIYYSIYSDPTFGNFIKKYGLLDPAKLRAFDPNAEFPVGSLTLKAAWKIVNPGEDVSTFYTRKAQVAPLAMQNGKIVIVKNGKPLNVTVALVGFHVAGAVKDHPEMIWATFEHIGNAPDIPKPVNDMAPNDIVSDKNWLFYKANTPFKDCNINSAGAGALTLDAAKQTLSPVTQVCRIIPWGGGNQMNIDNIKALNASVQALFEQKDAKSVWKNYFEVGAIWFSVANGLKPNCTFQPGSLSCAPGGPTSSILTGSTQLSNTAVETFTQSQSAQDNCFACHNTVQVTSPNPAVPALPGLNVDISHVLINEYFKAAGKTPPSKKP